MHLISEGRIDMGTIRSRLKKIDFIYKPYMALKWKTVLKWKQKQKIRVFHENAYSVLDELERKLQDSGLETFISFGTLLGFIRDKAIIPYDDDIDICILNYNDSEWDKLADVMKSCNMTLTRAFFFRGKKVVCTYSKKGVNVDFYLFTMEGGKPVTYSFWPIDKNKSSQSGVYEDYKIVEYHYPKVKKIEEENIHDILVLIPENSKEILEYLYGEGWIVPDPKFSHAKHAKYIDKVKVVYYV